MTAKETKSILKKRMTGDVKKDADILYLAMQEFSSYPDAKEIQETISKMMDDLTNGLDESEKNEVVNYIQSQIRDRFAEKVYKIHSALAKKNLEKAYKDCMKLEEEAKRYMHQVSMEVGKDVRFKLYQKQGEFYLGDTYYRLENQMSFPFDYILFLIIEVQVLYLMGKKEEAISTIHRLYDYNPVSIDAILLEASIQEKEGNEYSYKSCMKKAQRYIFEEKTFLTYFSYLANFYSTFMKNEAIASTLNKMSSSKSYQEAMKLMDDKTMECLSHDGFLVTLSDEVYDCFVLKAKQCIKKKNSFAYAYIYQCLLPFKGKEELSNIGLIDPSIAFEKKPSEKNSLTKGLTVEKKKRSRKASVSQSINNKK